MHALFRNVLEFLRIPKRQEKFASFFFYVSLSCIIALFILLSIFSIPHAYAAFPIIAQDTFHRNDQPYWGTASDQQQWQADAYNLYYFSIKGNKGQEQLPASDSNTYSAIIGPPVTDAEVVVSGYMDNSYYISSFGPVIRFRDASNFYKLFLGSGFQTGNLGQGPYLMLIKIVNGKKSLLSYVNYNAVLGTDYSLKFQVIGSQLSGKVWKTGTTEPNGWMVSATDTLLTSGCVGLRPLANNPSIMHFTSFIASGLVTNTPNLICTIPPPPTFTPTLTPTKAPVATNTPVPTLTPTKAPVATNTPIPTAQPTLPGGGGSSGGPMRSCPSGWYFVHHSI